MSAAATASADDEYLNFGTFVAIKLRNYLLPTRNKVQHKINHNIFAADLGLFGVSYHVSAQSPASQVSCPTTPSSAAGSEYLILSDMMCP